MLLKISNKMLLRLNTLIINNLRQCSVNAEKIVESVPEIPVNLEQKLLKVAVIGLPNVGKSTFINSLMDRKVCATSPKVHTTRVKAKAIFTEGNSQVIFLDTPGLVSFQEHKRFNLERSFMKDCKSSLAEADIVGVIHDVSNVSTRDRLDIKIIKLLEKHNKIPSFLVFNKIDILKSKRKLLDWTRMLTENCLDGKPIVGTNKFMKTNSNEKGWPYFKDIFMISSLTGSGLDDVKNYLIEQAKPAQWMFPEQVWTDKKAETIIIEAVKARLLSYLPQELPYDMKPCIEFFEMGDNGEIKTVVLVKCPTARKAKLAAGDSDGRLRQITSDVQRDLQDTFQNFVKIRILFDAPDLNK